MRLEVQSNCHHQGLHTVFSQLRSQIRILLGLNIVCCCSTENRNLTKHSRLIYGILLRICRLLNASSDIIFVSKYFRLQLTFSHLNFPQWPTVLCWFLLIYRQLSCLFRFSLKVHSHRSRSAAMDMI